MRFSIFPALIAAVAASPIAELVPRAATCSSLSFHTITVAGQQLSVKGPFKIHASAPGSSINGNFAHSGAPNYVPFVSLSHMHPHPEPYSDPHKRLWISVMFILTVRQVVFGVTASQAAKRASHYYLTSAGNLVQVQSDGNLYTAYEQAPTDTTGTYVSMGTGSAVNTGAEVYCAIDGPTCNLYCGLWSLTYNCLGSPGFQPDWLITGTSEANKPGCVKFTPKVVPG